MFLFKPYFGSSFSCNSLTEHRASVLQVWLWGPSCAQKQEDTISLFLDEKGGQGQDETLAPYTSTFKEFLLNTRKETQAQILGLKLQAAMIPMIV